jgi:hypothetical protein
VLGALFNACTANHTRSAENWKVTLKRDR